MVFYADNFDRGGDAELVGTGTPAWVGTVGLWVTNALGQAARVGATATTAAAVLGPVDSNDQEVSATIVNKGGAGNVGVIARATSTGLLGYAARVNSSGQWVIAAGNTALLNETVGTYSSGDRVTLRCIGSTITLLANGVVKLTLTDTTSPTGSYVGLRANSAATAPRYDLFAGGDYPPPTQSRNAVPGLGLRLVGTRRVVRPRVGTVGVGASPVGRSLTVRLRVATLGLGMRPVGRRIKVALSVARMGLGVSAAGREALVKRARAGLGIAPVGRGMKVTRPTGTVRVGMSPTGRRTLVRTATARAGLQGVPVARFSLVRTASARIGLGVRPTGGGRVVRFSRALFGMFGIGPIGTAARVDQRAGRVAMTLSERAIWSETDLTLGRHRLGLGLRAVSTLVRFTFGRLPIDPDLGGSGFPAQLVSGQISHGLSPAAIGQPLAARTAGLRLAVAIRGGTRDPQYDQDVTVTEVGAVTPTQTLVLGEVRTE